MVTMRVNSEAEMLQFGRDFAKRLEFPAIIELVGDVGAGKTTFTRGLAEGLGISEPVTSPSFTISKRYAFPISPECCKNYNISPYGELIHYDFYRLDDPGIMRDELSDSINQPNAIIVVEWGGGVADLLPETKYRLEISQLNDNDRELKVFHQGKNLTDLWKTCGKLDKSCGRVVEKTANSCANPANNLQNSCVKTVDKVSSDQTLSAITKEN